VTATTVRRFNPLLWLAGPMAACAAASLVFAMPLEAFGLRPPEPVFALVPAFAWGMSRPSVLPPVALVILGLFLDGLWGGPAGLWPLALLAAYAPVMFARIFLSAQGFWELWAWYAAACAAALATAYLLASLRAGVAADLVGVGWQFAVTVALFPFANRLIERYEDADRRFR
jgi:rod shape-determining protein MreD